MRGCAQLFVSENGMPASRFTVIPAPIETQIARSASRGWTALLQFGDARRVPPNATTVQRTLEHSVETRGVAFVLLCIILALVAVRQLIIRAETRRILKAHIDGEKCD